MIEAIRRGTVGPTVSADDPRYHYLSTRGLNRRFTGTPEAIHQVYTAEDVRRAVDQAVRSGHRIAVRSGGHCLDNLVDNAAVRALIDVSQLNGAHYDAEHNAFSVGSGTMLGEAYKQLYLRHGVVVPGGTCPTVGFGGYVQGAGFGALCRRHGLVVDHLYGVEVVVVDAAGQARTVVATRDPADPDHDLWWGHTGAGGGNFGVVTRFLFRSPDAVGTDPSQLLPAPPEAGLVAQAHWPWSGMNEKDFTRLVTNHGAWHAAHSDDAEFATLYSSLTLNSHSAGRMGLAAQIDGTLPNAAALMDSYLAALTDGVGAECIVRQRTMPWLETVFSSLYAAGPSLNNRYKGKGAYLRRPFSGRQTETLYRYLSDQRYTGVGTVDVLSYGGAINTVDPAATVAAQRDSILKVYLGAAWADPADDDRNATWVRAFYRDMYAATGGVPAPDTDTDGSYINYPDTDLADPEWNTSGIPWSTLYFKDNYPRLQSVKARYDPSDVFRHGLSVRLPES